MAVYFISKAKRCQLLPTYGKFVHESALIIIVRTCVCMCERANSAQTLPLEYPNQHNHDSPCSFH
jgi:hypothetical protein